MPGFTMRKRSLSSVARAGYRFCLAVTLAGAVVPRAVAAPSEATTVASRIWDKLLTKCEASTFYAGSTLDRNVRGSYEFKPGGIVTEFRGAHFPPQVTIAVSEADRLNGMAQHMRIVMIASAYRTKSGTWSDGPATRPRNINDLMRQADQNVDGDDDRLGNSGAIALELQKQGGHWTVARSSTMRTVSAGVDAAFIDIGTIQAARYDCKTGEVVQPSGDRIKAVTQESEEAARQAEAAARRRKQDADDAATRAALRARATSLPRSRATPPVSSSPPN